jgi:hypothetical protein
LESEPWKVDEGLLSRVVLGNDELTNVGATHDFLEYWSHETPYVFAYAGDDGRDSNWL